MQTRGQGVQGFCFELPFGVGVPTSLTSLTTMMNSIVLVNDWTTCEPSAAEAVGAKPEVEALGWLLI